MEPVMITFPEKKFIGKRIQLSLTDNKTCFLWRSFMPDRNKINYADPVVLYSIEIYKAGYFDHFDPGESFEKWAAVEVSDFSTIPEGMESLAAPGGLYAVFIHKGLASEGPDTYRTIFTDWLPRSGFEIDLRPHFAVMGEKYKNDRSDSEEELWIPVRPRK